MGDWMRTAVRRTGLTFVAAGGVLNGISCSGDDVTSPATGSTGSLQVTASTTGPDPDPDGYTFAVDGGSSQPIGVTASATLPKVAGGAHNIQLSGIAENCSVQGANPRSVLVSDGNLAQVTFAVACQAIQQGSRIAFISDRDGNPEIYVMNSNGTGLIRLTNTPESESGPSWSPDGTRIAFSRDGDIYIVNANGSGQSRLTNSASASSPTWSPDGTRIAFLRPGQGDYPDLYQEIVVMNADGTGLVPLTREAANYSSPDWSRDGKTIAFADWAEDAADWIGFINADGSDERAIYDEIYSTCRRDPAWSTGGGIAFSSTPYVDVVDRDHRVCQGKRTISVMNPDGSGVIQLTNNSANDFQPAWARDDRKVAFVSDRDGNSEIYVMNADGTGQTRLTDHPANDSEPSWSP